MLFGIVYALLSVGNNLCFRTYGLDLGLYTHTLYDYAHLRAADTSFFLWSSSNLLSDHFDLLLMLLSPLVYLLGGYTLIVVQIVAVLAGGLGVYRLAREYGIEEWPLTLLMALLLLQFGVWHALGFDYHSNVVCAMALPWMLLMLKRHRWGWATALLVFLLIGKETMSLWVTAVLVALMWDYRHDRAALRWLTFGTLVTLAYFALVALLIMPAIGENSGRGFWRYEWMGTNVGEVACWVLTHPLEAVRDIFVDFTPEGGHGGEKVEFFVCTLLCGGALLFVKPNYLLMLVPPVVMKMLSADTGFWGLTYHYNAEVAVVLTVGTVAVLAGWEKGKAQRWTSTIVSGLALITLIYSVSNPESPIRKENLRLYDSRHYHQTDFDADAARRMIGKIPDGASVCATTMFTPHVALRDSVYIFPMGLAYGADYWLLLEHSGLYYEGEEETVQKMIGDTAHYRIIDTDGSLYLLQHIR